MEMQKKLLDLIDELHQECAYESFDVEFKRAREKLPTSFWDTYSSFANTLGGYILLGVNEKPSFKITGVDNPQKMIEDLCNTANNSTKVNHNLIDNNNIKRHIIDGKTIISVYIPELPLYKKPLYIDGKIEKTFLRKNEGDYLATNEDIRRFIRNSHDDLDSELLDDYILEDLDNDSILRFKNLIHNRNPSANYLQMDNLSFLKTMGIFQIDRKNGRVPKLTIAGLLFLGKLDAIYQKFPHFHLEYINQRNTSPGERWKDRVCTGDLSYNNLNLFEFFHIVYDKLRNSITDSFALDERSIRKTTIELETALKEALANMITHADYFDNETDLKILVEDLDYIFTNPGNMRVSKTQFFTGGKSSPRNNTLIQYFRKLGISDRAGTGGREILDMAEQNRYHLPELTTDDKSTTLKIWVASPTPAEEYPDLSPEACKILSCLVDLEMKSSSEIKKETSISTHYFLKAINELQQRKLIRISGVGRATRYQRNPSIVEQIDAFSKVRDYLMHHTK